MPHRLFMRHVITTIFGLKRYQKIPCGDFNAFYLIIMQHNDGLIHGNSSSEVLIQSTGNVYLMKRRPNKIKEVLVEEKKGHSKSDSY